MHDDKYQSSRHQHMNHDDVMMESRFVVGIIVLVGVVFTWWPMDLRSPTRENLAVGYDRLHTQRDNCKPDAGEGALMQNTKRDDGTGKLGVEQDTRVHRTEKPDRRVNRNDASSAADLFREVEQIVVQHPWPVLLAGFAVGYCFAHSQVR